MLRKLYDNADTASLATRARQKRFALFKDMVESLEPPLKILDVGGTEKFWDTMSFTQRPGIEITLLNVRPVETTLPNFTSVHGDARDMSQFPDKHFDIAFSNSVIEHVGGPEDQQAMAAEMRRVADYYFVQTPNRYFPVEPHFVFPFFQFLPLTVRGWLLHHFDLGWHRKYADQTTAQKVAASVRLLDKQQFLRLFPEAQLFEEKFYGLTKSFIAYTTPQRSPPGKA